MGHKRAAAIAIGRGDFHVAESDTALYEVRRTFLDALHRVAPQVMTHLRTLSGLPDNEAQMRICHWAQEYRLLCEGRPPRWIVSTAKLTLLQLAIRPDILGWCHAAASDWAILSDEQSHIQIKTQWDPTDESREAAERRIARELAPLMNGIELAATKAGGKSLGYKREPEHLEWLARYLVNCEAPEKLSITTSAVAVKQALRETAALIGLSLPPFPSSGRRGRPSKKNKKPSLSVY